MPLAKGYASGLKSQVADLVNVAAGGKGGSCVAAIFLSHFIKATRWAHLDIAGCMEATSASNYTPKGMTGKSIRALIQLCNNLSKTF